VARPPLSLGELIEHWTLVGQEIDLVSAKHTDTRLPFALLLKFYGRHGRFPRSRGELHPDAVEFVARALKADPASVAAYDWSGRSIERHHGQIRRHFGFRACGEAEGQKLAWFLAGDFAQRERRYDMVREQFLGECRVRQMEPPTPDQVDRYVRAALFQGTRLLSARVAGRLSAQTVTRLLALIGAGTGDDEDPDLLRMIKAAPGPVSLASLLAETGKLTAIGAFDLPGDLFRDVAPRVLKEWRDQAMTESPSHLRDHADDLKVALLAALLFCRRREITDDLVNLLISTVHRIGARAERRVTTELVAAFRRVQGKEGLLFRVADAALARPDDPVRRVVFPVVGEDNLRNLVAEYKSSGPAYRRTVQTTYRASYTNHYRAGLIRLLEVLQFRSEDSHQPVLEAVQLVRRHAASPQLAYYPEGETVPVHGGLAGDWADLVYRTDGKGRRRVVRSVYEIRTFEALVDQLRCKGIWVLGAQEFRNPDEDLVTDFAERRIEHYAALRKPLDPRDFITELQGELRRELQALDDAVPGLPWLEIAPRGRHGAIRLTPLDAAPEPANLGRLKKAIAHRWGMLRLIDVLKEAVLRSGCQEVIERAAGRGGRLGPGELLERLLLVIYAYGTGAGIRAVAAADRGADDRGPDEHDLYYARRWYLTTELVEALAVQVANATFAARHKAVWGEGSSAVASDSTHFGAWDQNLFTEWHSRYGGRGVLIYWHIERKSMVIHSQLLSCTASEVAAMIQGAIHHGTEMDVKANYVDTHGQSVVGFGLTRLLGFDLLPRIKRINHIRLYPPARGEEFPNLSPAMVGRAIDWDLIAAQYDDVIKYATSIKSNAASTAAILRRFHRTNMMHPAYQAMQEIGRAQRTIFVCRYLRDRELQREINAALNVAESWNAGNAVLHYGKGGDIPGNRRDEQELTVLCLRVLQASVSYLNTLLIQDVLDGGALKLAAEDQRAITPLFWSHIAPYGEVTLDMTRRISLSNDAIPDGEQAGT
jgi:TnpA family transposase